MGREPVGEPEALARAVSAEIRAEMGRQNLSTRALAEMIERSAPYVQDRVNDGKTFNLNDLEMVSNALGVRPGELMDRANAALQRQGYYELAAKKGEPEQDDQ